MSCLEGDLRERPNGNELRISKPPVQFLLDAALCSLPIVPCEPREMILKAALKAYVVPERLSLHWRVQAINHCNDASCLGGDMSDFTSHPLGGLVQQTQVVKGRVPPYYDLAGIILFSIGQETSSLDP
ncbi:hypothetical protein OIU84_003279 [Salix udensis]|uniref:Uncharacterized protein n=1 Tax=Salix udensis TaxID=889485 RepID=A0AAD6P5G6_9ROSI|nr:hypothetical protein OIU84_003279 [Salix udensis]